MQQKFYYNIGDKATLSQAVGQYKGKLKEFPKLKFVFMIDKAFFDEKNYIENAKTLINSLLEEGLLPQQIIISLEGSEHKFSTQEWNKIKEVEGVFSKKNISFGFEDMSVNWSVAQVENANKQIDNIVNEIKKAQLSPYEKLMMAYMMVADRSYKMEDFSQDHAALSRSVYGILNSDRCVCVGFSHLAMAVIEGLSDENIKMYENHVATSEDGIFLRGLHSCLIVHMKDEKYGIEGYYYLDPTNDNYLSDEELPTLNFFMHPIKDIKRFVYPYIKDKDLLDEEPEHYEKRTNRQEKDLIYSTKVDSKLSFTSDGYVMHQPFVEDLLTMYPKFKKKIEDKSLSNKFADAENKAEKAIKKLDILKRIRAVFEDSQVSLDRVERKQFEMLIHNALQYGNLNQLKIFKSSIKTKEENVQQETPLFILDKAINLNENILNAILGEIQGLEEDYRKNNDVIEEIFKNFAFYRDEFYQQLELSESVDLETNMKALRIVLKQLYPNANAGEISDMIDEIILECGNAREMLFEDVEDDPYVQYCKLSLSQDNGG